MSISKPKKMSKLKPYINCIIESHKYFIIKMSQLNYLYVI